MSTQEERLEAAGWEGWQSTDLRGIFWRDPQDGLWHAQAEAVALLEASGGESDRDALVNERPLVPNAAEEPEELFEQ